MREEKRKLTEKSRNRWKKKIEGKEYISDTEDTHRDQNSNFNLRKISHQLEPLAGNDALSQQYEHRRKNSFLNENKPTKNFLGGTQVQTEVSHDHRRKRFDDLKSVQDRKKEMGINEQLMRSFD